MKKLTAFLLLMPLIPNMYAQSLQWAKRIGGFSAEVGQAITVDDLGNVYSTGLFRTTVDFDPGNGVYNLAPAGSSTDIFISKLDADGNFIWARKFGGPSDDEWAYSIAVDDFGNVYTTGYFSDSADFDPGSATYNLYSAGNKDIFISKLDANGNFVWAISFGNTTSDEGRSLTVDNSGVYVTGYYNYAIDFDPGVGVYNLSGTGDVFILKLDLAGNFIFAGALNGGTYYEYGLSIAVDDYQNVYTTGHFKGNVDFDPGPGTFNLSYAGGNLDVFVSKLDAAGNFVWAKSMGGIGAEEGKHIAVDRNGNVYTLESV